MARYKLKRYSYNSNDSLNAEYGMVDIQNRVEDLKQGLTPLASIGIIGLVGAFIYSIIKFFKNLGSSSNKYKASAQEIENIKKELPQEYYLLRDIKNKVINDCPFIYSCENAFKFFSDTLPSLLNLNGEGWIAGWARETGKGGKNRWAPILSMYDCNFVLCYDFTSKYWFVLVNKSSEYAVTTTIWEVLLVHFLSMRDKIKKLSINEISENVKRLSLTYLDLNIKLLKKNSKVKTRQKSFAFLGWGNVAKNWNNAGKLWAGGNKMGAIGSGAKAIGTGTLYTGLAGVGLAAGTAALAAPKAIDYATGESAAKQMEFSNKFRLKRKTYAEDSNQQKKGMGFGTKLALGAGATALAFAGARRGAFGTGLQQSTNRLWGDAGAALTRNGFNAVGEKMMMSGSEQIGKAKATELVERLKKAGLTDANKLKDRAADLQNRAGSRALDNFLKKSTPTPVS